MSVDSHSQLPVRTVFLSDIHLGARECRGELLLEFLHRVQMRELYLVGDVVDVWSMRRSFYWPQLHNDVLRTIREEIREREAAKRSRDRHDR